MDGNNKRFINIPNNKANDVSTPKATVPPKFEAVKAELSKALMSKYAVEVISKIKKQAGVEVTGLDGKPIVAHVIDMFPGESNFIFICNQEHLDEPAYRMEAILKESCPSGRVIGISPHKLGPINAVRQVEHLLDPTEPVVVNYCDFTCYWDWRHFKQYVNDTACVGAIPAYKGFHPHSLGNTNYAYLCETDGWIHDIQEKQPYTNNRMEEYASSGTYYFASVQIMIDAFRLAMEQDFNVGGEYYVSLAYKVLFSTVLSFQLFSLFRKYSFLTSKEARKGAERMWPG